MQKLLVPPEPSENDAARASTDGRRQGPAEKALRGMSTNATVVAVSMLSEADHNIFVRVVLTAGQAVEEWHSSQSQRLRSSSDRVAWLTEQVSGQFLRHVSKTLSTLCDVQALQFCRLVGGSEAPLPAAR